MTSHEEDRVESIQVNLPLAPALFTLDFPEGAVISDQFLGKRFQVGRFDPGVGRVMTEVIQQDRPAASGPSSRFWSIAAVNLATLAVIVFLVIRRRRERIAP